MTDFKQYTESARRGIRGEAFFESLVVSNMIPHRIKRENDLGVDFLCEWVAGDRPTGILLSAQVKSTTSRSVTPEHVETSRLNRLETYTLKGAKKPDDATLNYWMGLGFPAYLFYVVENEGDQLECYYKRYTPLLDDNANDDDKTGSRTFYKVNDSSTFHAFADVENETHGFARDLIVDYARMSYSRGIIVRLLPEKLGFWPFPDKSRPTSSHVFGELFEWHRDAIHETWKYTGQLLNYDTGTGRITNR